jgi:transposase
MKPTRGQKLVAEANRIVLRTKAATMHELNPTWSASKVATRLGMSSRWVLKWWNQQDFRTRARSGRPPKMTAAVVSTVKRSLGGVKQLQNGGYAKKADPSTVIATVKRRHGIQISRTSMYRAAKKSGLKPKRPSTKPLFTQSTVASRLKFATVIEMNV